MSNLPEHDAFLQRIADVTKKDTRLLGLLVGGSLAWKTADAFSDLDCVIVAKDDTYREVLANGRALAEQMGPLMYAFSGKIFGEPRLLICLYQTPLLHVDFKILTPEMLAYRVEDPEIVWEYNDIVSSVLSTSSASWPQQSPELIEEHFWIWIHYAAAKLGRGEIFEALDMIALLRKRIFGPLLARQSGKRQYELRRIEQLGDEAVQLLTDLTPPPDKNAGLRALSRAIDAYLQLTSTRPPKNRSPKAEEAVRGYIDRIREGSTEHTKGPA